MSNKEAVLDLVASIHNGLRLICEGLQEYSVTQQQRDASPERKKKSSKDKKKKKKAKKSSSSSKEEPKRAPRVKKPRDPNAPKAPKSPLCRYRDDPQVRAAYKEKYPNLSAKDIQRNMSEKFSKMNEDDKKRWTEPHAVEMAAYKKKCAEYEASKAAKPSVIPVAAKDPSSSSSSSDNPFFN